MIEEKQIDDWLKRKVITKKQADTMLADITKEKKERRSSKFIMILSTIGAILLGLSAILFIASNWEEISNIVKVAILVGSTAIAYYLGYMFKYDKKNLPKVGASLIFLSTLLFGATIFLIAQMYNINANNYLLVLIWLIGVLPLVYAFNSMPIAALSSILYYVWIGLFIFRDIEFRSASGDFWGLPVLYLVSSLLLFAIGTFHYSSYKDIARIFRISGIKVALLSIFLLTFKFFSGIYGRYDIRSELTISSQFTGGFIAITIFALLAVVINLFFKLTKSDTSIWENSISLGLVAVALIFFFFPATTNIYTILFNIIMAGVILALFYLGYDKEDMALVNIAMFWASGLIVFRYFDWFWDLLPKSLFFLILGLILVLGGMALEKKRKKLRIKFGA